MDSRTCVVALFVALSMHPVAVNAQSGLVVGDLRGPVPGDTVRVEGPRGVAATGIFQSASPDSLWLVSLDTGFPMAFRSDEVEKLERSAGKHRRFARNFALSVGIGAVVGGAIGAMTWSPCTDTGFMACFMAPDSRGAAFGWGAGFGAVIGVPIGVLAGLTKTRKWETVRVPGVRGDDGRLVVQPIVGQRVGVQLSLPLGSR